MPEKRNDPKPERGMTRDEAQEALAWRVTDQLENMGGDFCLPGAAGFSRSRRRSPIR